MSEAASTSLAPPRADDRRTDDSRTDIAILALAAAVLALSAFLQTRGGQDVVIPGLDVTLPDACHLRRWTGVDCAGCGLTRSFIRLAHGDPLGAWSYHPIGPFLFALVALQAPYRAWQIWRVRTGRGRWRGGRWTNAPLTALLVVMLVRWVVNLILIYG